MKPIFSRVLIALFLLSQAMRAEVILQYFGTTWNEIERRIPELAERGYDSLWLPPPFKAGAGTYSVGFDTLDRFDLGDRNQSGTVRTKYGTKADLVSLMRVAHRFGIRVYFDNVMAHNAGPLDSATQPGQLFPGVPGFVPEDFHIVRDGTTWRKPADYPDYENEWEVLNRNPFAWDIAQEGPNNASFNPTGTAEGQTFPKWSGVRHPGRTEWYPDTDLTIGTNGAGEALHPFANKEPFQDVGYLDGAVTIGANNGRLDFKDLNTNGQHEASEPSEPFTDTGVDPTVVARQTASWGFGDNKYNMGNPASEDVNQMLFRAVRWFIEETKPDGFRLDAVKHVPSGFFGKQDGADKDLVNWGYNGQIQEQFNISRGFGDWNNHRDTLYNSEYQSRDDAMLFGEHLGSPPAEGGYLSAGMRIANDNILNAVKNGMGASLAGYDQTNHAGFGTTSQSVAYVMSHDNNYLYGGDRPLAHAYILTREGLPIVYTDGYNQASDFPKPSGVNFLGQFGDNSVVSAVAVHRDFARGYQIARWSETDFAAYERVDNRENKDGGSWNGQTMLYMMARNYQPNGQGRLVQTGFPVGATLINQSPYGGKFPVYVNGSGQVVDGSGNAPLVPPGGWFAFTWHNPGMPLVWQAAEHKEEINPIEIYQSGVRAGTMDHWRVDGKDGDATFNPFGVPAGDTANKSYRVEIPRVTDGTNLRFVARADGSADNIRMKLDGGVNINSQMGLGPQTGDLRDFPPGLNTDQVDAANPSDRVLQASTDTYLGYEQMQFVRRTTEKFAAVDRARNVIGSVGSETYQAVVGTAGVTVINGSGVNNTGGSVASWAEHNPAATNEHLTTPVSQMNPPPQTADGQAVDLWVKVGYQFQVEKVWVYYTTDGTSYPEGSHGVGKGNTQVVEAGYSFNGTNDGTAIPDWWKATLPAMSDDTVLRYKIGVRRPNAAPPVFPFNNGNIDLAKRMETLFEINNFNATTAPYQVHNDYSQVATGLSEGFHVLRSRAFVGRGDGASIFKTNTQVFYYDALAPAGEVAYPHESDQLGGSSYGAVVITDPSVTEVWYYIDDLDAGNDSPANGNGVNNWKLATAVTVPTNLGSSAFTKEWHFTYQNIPASGIANLVVRLKEASSAADMGLSDATGHFTTLTRHVTTGSSINFNIGYPSFAGETVDKNYIMKVYFKKELIPVGMTDQQFLNEFSIFISSSVSGQPDNPVFQPRSGYTLVRDVNATEHSVEFTFPNLYNGMPNFLHTVRAEHQRGSLSLGDGELVKMRVDDDVDADNDGLPNWWELQYGIEANNPAGRHGASGDFDLDGVTNLTEYLFGMIPALEDLNSVPRVTLAPHASLADTWTLGFPTIPNRIYQWQASQTLGSGGWQNIGSPVSTAGATAAGTIQRNDTGVFSKRFYRMSVSPSP
ncbi:MAG: alpha-amylase family glycosyl hydrolase [Verrucomicrobiota bacterium]